jgi:hypothetical protein
VMHVAKVIGSNEMGLTNLINPAGSKEDVQKSNNSSAIISKVP